MLKQSEFALKIDDQNLHVSEVNSDSEQEHNNLSHKCSEASAAGKDVRFRSITIHSRQHQLQRLHSDKIFSIWKLS